MKFYGLYVLWRHPLIVSCFAGKKEEEAAFSINESADILFHPTWLWSIRNIPWFAKQRIRQILSNKRVHFICSSSDELRLLRRLRFPTTLSSINGFIN